MTPIQFALGVERYDLAAHHPTPRLPALHRS